MCVYERVRVCVCVYVCVCVCVRCVCGVKKITITAKKYIESRVLDIACVHVRVSVCVCVCVYVLHTYQIIIIIIIIIILLCILLITANNSALVFNLRFIIRSDIDLSTALTLLTDWFLLRFAEFILRIHLMHSVLIITHARSDGIHAFK